MTLYEINQQILSLIDEETGEITDFEQLDKLQIERDIKLENIALWIKNLKAEEEALAAEQKSFAERREAAANKRKRLEEYLASALNGNPFITTKVKCTFRKSQAVVIDEADQLSAEYTKTTVEPDKTAIKQAIKEGKEVAGARLVDRLNLQIK